MHASSASAAFGAFTYWPEHLEWSTQMMRLIGYASVGGADFSEVEAVARTLPVGDDEAWYAGFSALARALDEAAERSRAGGHLVSARETWLRASVYHRISGQLRAIGGDGSVPGVDDSRRCFRAAAALSETAVEPVEIPYEGTTLPGYRVAPRALTHPTPAVIVVGGIDAFSEEMYLKIGRALADRGYTALLFDGPGQGEARQRGIHARHDYEVPVAAAIDFLAARPEIDADRIALVGSSLGGYYATRAAAYERRLRACVIWGASEGIDVAKLRPGGALESRLGQVERLLGVTGDELLERAARFDLDGVAERIACPTLILHGESDVLVPVEAAQRTYEEIRHERKHLIVYPAGQPGCTHCQLDALPLAQRDICDWLDNALAAPVAR